MIYWFQNLPPKSFEDDKWKPVISHKWLRENFIAAVWILNIFLAIILISYIRSFVPAYDYSISPENPIYKILKYLTDNRSMLNILIVALIIIQFIIHEMLHVAVIFNKGDFSITFSNLIFRVITNAELSKFRYFAFIFLPLFALTIVPFVISLFIPYDLAFIVRIFTLLNLSSADIINIVFILPKPNKAIFCRGMYYTPTI